MSFVSSEKGIRKHQQKHKKHVNISLISKIRKHFFVHLKYLGDSWFKLFFAGARKTTPKIGLCANFF